jgi:hypothetical protein
MSPTPHENDLAQSLITTMAAPIVRKKIVVAGGNGFLGMLSIG